MTINIEQPEDWDAPYTPEERSRVIRELLDYAGAEGMHQDDILSALQAFSDLFASAALLDLWMDRRVRLGWRDGELTFTAVVDDEQEGN